MTCDDDNNGDAEDHYDWDETLHYGVAAVTLSLYLINHSRLYFLVEKKLKSFLSSRSKIREICSLWLTTCDH